MVVMKLDPLFYVKSNQLYKISDNSAADLSSIQKFQIKWSEVELDDENYNEEFLAQLRDKLKSLDNVGKFAIIVPVADKPLETPEQEETFTAAFNHCARRIKDCVSVVGFELESKLKNPDSFIEALSVKHAQYVYFTNNKNASENIVIY